MNRKKFFQIKTSEIKNTDIIASLNTDTIEVLNEKYQWVSKINESERERNTGLRNMAGILLGLHIGFTSLLLSGSFFNLFTELIKNNSGMLFAASITIFIFGSLFLGIYYSVKVSGVPRLVNVIDPTLSLEPYESCEVWLKGAIAETLIVYKRNLEVIGSNAFRTRLSFDFLILAIFASILAVAMTKTSLVVEEVNFTYYIMGGFVGFVLLLIVRYILIEKPRSYEK